MLSPESFRMILLVGAAGSLLGLRIAQEVFPDPGWNIEWLFSLFSLVVGLAIFVRTLKGHEVNGGREDGIRPGELIGLAVSGVFGGAITAWLSIGVGEVLAIYLLVLRFRINLAVAVAVCVTSITVITGVPFYFGKSAIVLEVLVFAAPGALIGGDAGKATCDLSRGEAAQVGDGGLDYSDGDRLSDCLDRWGSW